MVQFFLEELAGDVLASVKRRGESVAIILSPSAYGGSLDARVALMNQLAMCVAGSGTAAALMELLAS